MLCAGPAQMEWLWSGGKGQMGPSCPSQLPPYLFIVSWSPRPAPSPASFCHLPVSQPQTPEGAWARVLSGLLVSGQVGRWGLREGRKEGGREARRGCQSL